MWFLRKPPVKVNCFFCKVEVAKEQSFELEYRAKDGIGKVNMCPMCAGMVDDMPNIMRGITDD